MMEIVGMERDGYESRMEYKNAGLNMRIEDDIRGFLNHITAIHR